MNRVTQFLLIASATIALQTGLIISKQIEFEIHNNLSSAVLFTIDVITMEGRFPADSYTRYLEKSEIPADSSRIIKDDTLDIAQLRFNFQTQIGSKSVVINPGQMHRSKGLIILNIAEKISKKSNNKKLKISIAYKKTN